MACGLTNITDLKTFLGIAQSDTTEDALLKLLIRECTSLIESNCKRKFGQAVYTEIYAGNARASFALNQRPVTVVTLTGGTTTGSTTITGIDTTNLVEGLPLSSSAFPPGSVVVAVNPTAEEVVMSEAATETKAAARLVFGIAVWLDTAAWWGEAIDAFADGTFLQPGVGYVLAIDTVVSPTVAQCHSGLLVNKAGYWPKPFVYNVGQISPSLGSIGNVKVMYLAGFGEVPTDVELACNNLIATVRNSRQYGEALASESVKDYGYTLRGAAKMGFMSDGVASVLANYRTLAIG